MSFLKDCYLTDETALCGTWESKKNGKRSTVCYQTANCSKSRLCSCIRIPKEKIKKVFVKCCGVCDNAGFCKYLREKKEVQKTNNLK
jgi:hypothetical protein